MKFVFINNSVATKKGKRDGITEFAQRFNPLFIATKLVFENRIRQMQNIKNINANIFFFIFKTKNWHFENIINHR